MVRRRSLSIYGGNVIWPVDVRIGNGSMSILVPCMSVCVPLDCNIGNGRIKLPVPVYTFSPDAVSIGKGRTRSAVP